MDERTAKRARCKPTMPAAMPTDKHDSVSSFLQSWAWKREHRPDRDRFERPYVHPLTLRGDPKNGTAGSVVQLTVKQARFRGAQGFASTVWDSSIVVAKMLERHPELVVGRRVLDLSAGCGLVALVAARLGAARTVATDLAPNLPLLRSNCARNGATVEVREHWWGTDTSPLLRPRGRSGLDPQQILETAATTAATAATATAAAEASTSAAATAPERGDAGGDSRRRGGAKLVQDSGGQRGVLGRGAQPAPEASEASAAGGQAGPGDGLDLVIACDVMYQEEAIGALVTTLASLCGGSYDCVSCNGGTAAGGRSARESSQSLPRPPNVKAAPATAACATPPGTTSGGAVGSGLDCPRNRSEASPGRGSLDGSGGPAGGDGGASGSTNTTVILAHGRNRFAEAAFWRHAAAAGFTAESIPWEELDSVYRCSDVDVYRLRLRQRRG